MRRNIGVGVILGCLLLAWASSGQATAFVAATLAGAPHNVPIATATKLHLHPSPRQAGVSEDTPALCGGAASATGSHSVCGIIDNTNPLLEGGSGTVIVIIPAALAFTSSNGAVSILATNLAYYDWTPNTCVFSAAAIYPTEFAINYTGCARTPVIISYMATSATAFAAK
ncbi:MAG TPA: hypothetical protein VIJ64_12265 [Candidatus Lustribacter sp.]